MKKLAIALAVVALAAASQAASMKWGYTAPSSAERGNIVYIILGSEVPASFANAAAVSSASIDSATIGKVGKSGSGASSTASNESLTAASSMYAIMVSADEKQWAATTVFTPGADYVYGEQDSEKDPFPVASFGAMKDFGGSAPIPEPTSGLLVLLGVAGLALRRKRA